MMVSKDEKLRISASVFHHHPSNILILVLNFSHTVSAFEQP
jgi:hypothetical protein